MALVRPVSPQGLFLFLRNGLVEDSMPLVSADGQGNHNDHIFNRLLWEDSQQRDAEFLMSREWLVTNGLGGYASGSIAGIATRRYHGVLIARALPAPARPDRDAQSCVRRTAACRMAGRALGWPCAASDGTIELTRRYYAGVAFGWRWVCRSGSIAPASF